MSIAEEHSVGLRELRHHTSDVLARVRHGETIEITEYGKPVARLVPIDVDASPSILTHLAAQGRVRLATRPGFRPAMRAGDGSNLLTDTLAAMRDEERW
jgi:prevent-host-death family protein